MYTLSNLFFDGKVRDEARGLPRALSYRCEERLYGERHWAANLSLSGRQFRVHNVYSVQALCGSAMEVDGSGFELWNKHVGFNGTAQDETSTPTIDVWSASRSYGAMPTAPCDLRSITMF